MATFKLSDKYSSLMSEIKSQESSLKSSPTAFLSGSTPNIPDLNADARLRSLQNQLKLAEAQHAASRWYPDKTDEPDLSVKEKPKLLERAIDALNQPLYAAVGAAKKVTGQTSEPLLDAMQSNMSTHKQTFGDVLIDMNVPRWASVPLGFALDIGVASAIDPLAILGASSARYGSTIQKVGAGLKHGFAKESLPGALQGAKTALSSSALEKASRVASITPKLSSSKAASRLYDASEAAQLAYDKTIGETFMDVLDRGARHDWYGPGLGSFVQDQVKKYVPKGEWFWDTLVGVGNEGWYRNARIRQTLESAGLYQKGQILPEAEEAIRRGAEGALVKPGRHTFEEATTALKHGQKHATDMPPLPNLDQALAIADDVPPAFRPATAQLRAGIDEALEMASAPPSVTRGSSSEDIVSRFMEEYRAEYTFQELIDYVNKAKNKTDLGMYDDLVAKARSLKVSDIPLAGQLAPVKFKDTNLLAKTLDAYEIFIGLFKTAKIGGSLTARINAIIGNPVMAGMEGRDIFRSHYSQSVKEALSILRGKAPVKIIEDLTTHPEIGAYIRNNPMIFNRIFGFNPAHLDAEKVLKAAGNSKEAINILKKTKNKDQIIKDLDSLSALLKNDTTRESLEKAINDVVKSGTLRPDMLDDGFVNYVSSFLKRNGRLPSADEVPINFSANFIDYGAMANFKLKIKEAADKGDTAAKLMNWYLTRPMGNYELIDHSYRLGQFMADVKFGLTAKELEKISRFYKIAPSDIIQQEVRQGQRFYKLSADKAAEIASGTYMNYSAMPAAVKFLRNVPVLGSPFASFGYGMLGKTASTMVLNPTYFNKTQLAIHNASLLFAGQQSPLEREAIQGKQAYLDNPWQLRFFSDHPVYLNVENMIPFLSNLLSPHERKWSGSVNERAGKILDSAPVMRDPIGQWFMSYFVLPLFLDEGSIPQNVFGSPLLPKDATAGEKARMAVRDVAEAVVPGVAGYAAIPAHYLGPEALRSQEVIQNIPSYQYRSLANALQGLTAVGAGSKQSIDQSSERAVRKALGIAGLPLTPVNLSKKQNRD